MIIAKYIKNDGGGFLNLKHKIAYTVFIHMKANNQA